MNLKIILCLALGLMIFTGLSFGDEPQTTNDGLFHVHPPSQHLDLKVVIEASKPDIHFSYDFLPRFLGGNSPFQPMEPPPKSTDVVLKIRVENQTAADQYITEVYSGWAIDWTSSNPEIYWPPYMGSDGLTTVKIPSGGAHTHELRLFLNHNKPISGNKASFRLEYKPTEDGQTFWSNEVELRVVDDTPYCRVYLTLLGVILGPILGLALICWAVRLAFQRWKSRARPEQRPV